MVTVVVWSTVMPAVDGLRVTDGGPAAAVSKVVAEVLGA
jgi:hypothetical protein